MAGRASGEEPPGGQQVGESKKPADLGLQEKVSAKALYEASLLGADKPTRKEARKRYFRYGERPVPIPSFRGPVEDPPKDAHKHRTGICCSGGGIRSAAFNLGALQSLQEAKELENADYLAAVSGGSYIAAAFSMVAKRWPEEKKLPPDYAEAPWKHFDDSDPSLFEDDKPPPFARKSPEEQYLRNRSSYMAPDGSAKLYLGIRLLLGLLVNVVFLAAPIFALSVLLGLGLGALPFFDELEKGSFDPPLGWWIIPVVPFVLGLLCALFRLVKRPKHDDARRGSETWSTRFVVASGVVAVMILAIPALAAVLASDREGSAAAATGAGGGAGFAGLVAGVIAYLREAIGTVKKVVPRDGKDGRMAKVTASVRRALPAVAGAVLGPLLFLAVAAAGMAFALDHTSNAALLLLGAAGGLAAWVVAYSRIDITSLSLHPFYKRRLCSAFALKRVRPEAVGSQRAVAGIGQDSAGVAVERDYGRLVSLSRTALDKWPALIVCAAANVSDPAATPPGRRVTSFTFSANTVGGPLVGAMDTTSFEETFEKSWWRRPAWWNTLRRALSRGERTRERKKRPARGRDFSLPAAVAVSGAALSPSMGKETSRSLTFLLALANIRLGVWVPNPRWVAKINTSDEKRRRRQLRDFGRPRPSWLLKELLGRNRVDAKYLYVTDGGHYENLGLVELLRRGCTRIFCLDASGGKFSALGDAIALARSELGVEIDIDPTPLSPKGDPPTAERDTVTGTIKYATGEEGFIVYARNVMSPDGPWDVRAHQLDDPAFPHDSTRDQLYTDQKFESYRALGAGAGGNAAERMHQLAPLHSQAPRPVETNHPIPPERVKRLLNTAAIQLIDVRKKFAHEMVRIDGARHIELASLHAFEAKLYRDHPVVVHCDDGERSRGAAHDLCRRGWNASSMAGGIARWVDDGLPVARGAPPEPAAAAAPNGHAGTLVDARRRAVGLFGGLRSRLFG